MSSRKLKHYFLSHKIKVVSSYPLGTIIHNRDAVGRIAKWSVELGQYDIEFVPRTAIKSQALADFVTEWTNPKPEEETQNPEHWLMFYDGAKCKNGAGASVILISLEGDAMRYAIQIDFTNPTPTNNIIEYEGLLTGLRIAISLGIKRLLMKGDSEVVTKQISKDYQATTRTWPQIYSHTDDWNLNLMDSRSNTSREN
jgi:ribonuclease HI